MSFTAQEVLSPRALDTKLTYLEKQEKRATEALSRRNAKLKKEVMAAKARISRDDANVQGTGQGT